MHNFFIARLKKYVFHCGPSRPEQQTASFCVGCFCENAPSSDSRVCCVSAILLLSSGLEKALDVERV